MKNRSHDSAPSANPLLLIVAVLVLCVAIGAMAFSVGLFGTDANQAETDPPSDNPRPPIQASIDDVRSSKRGLRVLFVGNSFTHANDMPGMVRQLAVAAREELPLLALSETPGGFRLQQHWEQGNIKKLIEEIRWDFVVLQEQSQLPSFIRSQRKEEVDPFARKLHDTAKARGGRVVLFMTWGYKVGDQRNVPGDSYAAMQQRLRQGYQEIASDLKATIAPVGVAWREAVKQKPQLDLWSGDGSHPSPKGTYLAACVFYAVLYGSDPRGNGFTAGLDTSEAKFLQDIAAASTGK